MNTKHDHKYIKIHKNKKRSNPLRHSDRFRPHFLPISPVFPLHISSYLISLSQPPTAVMLFLQLLHISPITFPTLLHVSNVKRPPTFHFTKKPACSRSVLFSFSPSSPPLLSFKFPSLFDHYGFSPSYEVIISLHNP